MPGDWQENVPRDALSFPPGTAPGATASYAEPDSHGVLDSPAEPAQDTESKVPHDVWAGYFPDEAEEVATPEDAETDAPAEQADDDDREGHRRRDRRGDPLGHWEARVGRPDPEASGCSAAAAAAYVTAPGRDGVRARLVTSRRPLKPKRYST